MKSCLLVGAVGSPNFGDEAILHVWIKNYQNTLRDMIVVCDGGGANLGKCIDSMGVQNVRLASRMQSMHTYYEHFDFSSQRIKLKDIDSYKENIELSAKNLKEFGVQCIHLFGGGYINSMWAHNYVLLLSALLVARKANIPVFASGLGLLPCTEAHYQILKLFDYFSACDVRDTESISLLSSVCKSSDISCSGDDVLIAFNSQKNYLVKEEDYPSIVINLQNDFINGNTLASKILSKEILSVFVNKGIRNIKFIAAMASDFHLKDKAVLERIGSLGMTVTNVDEYTLLREGLPVNRNSFYITSRYHPHLIASLWGCRGLAVSNTEYYDIKHRSVNTMGSLWKVCNLNDIESIFSSRDAFLSFYDKTIPNNEMVKKHFVDKKVKFTDYLMKQIDKSPVQNFELDLLVDLVKAFKVCEF